jgi:photosystem II stability/assembly factor-like uncharacterized protein
MSIPVSQVECFAASESCLFAGSGFPGGVFRSTDHGENWVSVGLPSPWPYVWTLAAHDTNVFVGADGGVFRSTDNGKNWASTSLQGQGKALLVSGTFLFASVSKPTLQFPINRVFRSSDNGSSWEAANTGLPSAYVQTLAVSGTNLFAGVYAGGVYRSTDNGDNWVSAGLPLADVQALAMNETFLFASTFAGVFRSSDNGASWQSASTGMANLEVTDLAVSGTNVFAGSKGGGFFRSFNNGDTWHRLDFNDLAQSLFVEGGYFFAGTYSQGAWRRPLSELTSVESLSTNLPVGFSLSQNYPNPFNPSTTIRYELPRALQVKLSVYDILGREVSVLVNERREAGVHEVKFDGSSLASGVYFYRLSVSPLARRDLVPTDGRDGHAGDFTQAKRLLLLK